MSLLSLGPFRGLLSAIRTLHQSQVRRLEGKTVRNNVGRECYAATAWANAVAAQTAGLPNLLAERP